MKERLPRLIRDCTHWKSSHAALCALFTAWALVVPSGLQAQEPTKEERFVLDRLQGQPQRAAIDLLGADKQKRKLSAEFVKQILTDAKRADQIDPRGIWIENAEIIGDLNLENMEVKHDVRLESCRFLGNIRLVHTQFKKGLSLYKSNIEGSLNLREAQIGGRLMFGGALFEEAIDGTQAKVTHDVIATDAQFKNMNSTAMFDSMEIGGSLILRGARFSGGADFRHVHIGANLEANPVFFDNPDHVAIFNTVKIDRYADFQQAEFTGGADFRYVTTGIDFYAHRSQFKNPKNLIQFYYLKVGADANFSRALFAGGVDFTSAHVAGNFYAIGSTFLGSGNPARFNTMKVGDSLFIREAAFHGLADFAYADVGINFEAQGAGFFEQKTGLTLLKARVGGFSYLSELLQLHKINLSSVNLKSLELTFPIIDCSTPLHKLHTLDMFGAEIDDLFFLDNVDVTQLANLGHSKILKIALDNVEISGRLLVDSLSYQGISTGNASADRHKLLTLLQKSDFSADAYKTLEAFYRRQGQADDADEVFIRMKQREREVQLDALDARPADSLRAHLSNYWARLSIALPSYLHGGFVGYGVRPWRALAWGFGVVCLGAFFFGPEGMRKTKDAPETWQVQEVPRTSSRCEYLVGRLGALVCFWRWRLHREYNCFTYSLDIFVPGISLESAKYWQPKDDWKMLWLWIKVQRVAGWTIIPFGLVALSGLAKI